MGKETAPLFERVSDVAGLLSMSRTAVYRAVEAGALPSIRVGANWRIPRAAIQKLFDDAMEQRQVGPR
jgi:excisionase family DNA binding protein